jgi:ribosomal protein S18 acetylase RimI-like enzyme
MIKQINHQDRHTAKQILDVQIPAYKIEAQIIGFDGIPQLKDTVETIETSTELFIGYIHENQLIAFLSYTKDENGYQICRLVVQPDFFKQGIARKLLKYFMNEIVRPHEKVIVSTGADNVPAINLYKSEGFAFLKNIEVAPNFYISLFERETTVN